MKFVILNLNLDFICQVAQFLSENVFFNDMYVKLPVLLVKITFSMKIHCQSEFRFIMVIPFSRWLRKILAPAPKLFIMMVRYDSASDNILQAWKFNCKVCLC